MQNQVVSGNGLVESAVKSLKQSVVRLGVALPIALLVLFVLLSLGKLRSDEAVVQPQVEAVSVPLAVPAPVDAPVSSLEPAAEAVAPSGAAESSAPQLSAAPQVTEIPESYTQQYWDLADEWARKHALETGARLPGEAYYTERYWDQAAESAANRDMQASVSGASTAREIPESYTQQYWDLAEEWARQHELQSGKPRPEDAYYTERYWKLNE